MKILLDESLPVRLVEEFDATHEVLTVKDMSWLSKKNGELMKLVTGNNFEVFVTADRNLIYQQNTNKLTFIIAILCGKNNRIATYQSLIPKLLSILSQEPIPKVIKVL